MLGSGLGVDWSQRTTKLGAITLVGAAIAVVLIVMGKQNEANAVMGLAGTVAGTLGLATKD
ncbi:MAG: hypothetical protein PHU14_09920 [Methylovulum sp.]|nr:hypothetical protein [Methylovulum sp.]